MDEIHAWGGYEASTSQIARPLLRIHGRGSEYSESARKNDRYKYEFSGGSGGKKNGGDETETIGERSSRGERALDSIAKKIPEKVDEDLEIGDKIAADREHRETVHTIARQIFGVYFTANMKNEGEKEKHNLTRIQTATALFRQANGTMPWLPGFLKKNSKHGSEVLTSFLESSLRGISQVYFQNNPVSGLFILSGMFVQSSRVAIHGVIALVCGNIVGFAMGFDQSIFLSGLFGYNSFLLGLALATFYSPELHADYYTPAILGVVVFGSFSSVLFVMFGKILAPYKTPPFTLPFNASAMLFLLATAGMNRVNMAPVREPSLPDYGVDNTNLEPITARAFFAGTVRGLGQVYLANNLASGALVLIGITVCSRISAVAAFLGSAVGAGVAVFVGVPADTIENGMYGFNPSLSMVAMIMFYAPSYGSAFIGVAASVMTVFVQLALAASLEPCGLPFMTLPFCIIAATFVTIQGAISSVVPVPLSSMTTPEDHLKRVRMLSDGFGLLLGAIRSKNATKLRKSFSRVLTEHQLSSTLDACHEDDVNRKWFSRKRFLRIVEYFNETIRGNRFAKTNGGPVAGNPSAAAGAGASEEKRVYELLFRTIAGGENNSAISRARFAEFLSEVGFDGEEGIDFACEVLSLVVDSDSDLTNWGVSPDEFAVFAQISHVFLPQIQRAVIKFLDFVDVNGDRSIDVDELDSARAYLGLPAFSEEDMKGIERMAENGKFVVSYIAIAELKAIIRRYQANRNRGMGLDESLGRATRGNRLGQM